MRIYLEKEGYSTIISNNGEEGMVKFYALKPDIILLDIMLPGMDGWQICREIRKNYNTPILMITAKSEVFDKVLGLELGADDYIVKPLTQKKCWQGSRLFQEEWDRQLLRRNQENYFMIICISI